MNISTNTKFISFSGNLSSDTQITNDNKNLYLNSGVIAGTTALGTVIGQSKYNFDKVELQSSLNKAKDVLERFVSPELNKVKDSLYEKFIYLIQLVNEGRDVSVPNCMMVVGENSTVNNELIDWIGKKSDCNFIKITQSDDLLDYLEKAEANFKNTNTRTLIHVKDFDQLLNHEVTPDHIIEGLKSLMCCTSEDFHSTLIFDTKDPSKLDYIALQPHRVTERIEINTKNFDSDTLKSASQRVEEFSEKLKNLSKSKIFIGAAIGLVIGAIGIGIKHFMLDKKEDS